MILAIHQPNYLPWLGYFYKIYAADVFVFHDAVPFSKGSYTKRCKIRSDKAAAETTWLSLPVQRHPEGTVIADIQVNQTERWTIKHWYKIENTYASAPYFPTYSQWLKALLFESQSLSSLSLLNMFLIKAIAEQLALECIYHRSSVLPVSGKASALNLAIAKSLHATKYLAGTGSRNYQDNDAFSASGIEPIHHDFGEWLNQHPYEQGTGKFTGGLSVIDALMHIGADGIRQLFEKYQSEHKA